MIGQPALGKILGPMSVAYGAHVQLGEERTRRSSIQCSTDVFRTSRETVEAREAPDSVSMADTATKERDRGF